MYTTSDFRRGLRILFQGIPYEIVEFEHHKPGKGAAIVRTRLKNLISGLTMDPTFRSGDKVDIPDLNEREVQFLYSADEIYHFMDPSSYDQFEVVKKVLGDAVNFLIDGMICSLLFYEGKPINISIPNSVVLEVVECAPAVRGDTVSGATKPAKLQTGFSCQVPLFVNEGNHIKVDTRSGEYLERA
ncbi:MAG: elongation factor P [Myxococcaceae bacterium]|nr:elongation factor P [Myxococcaceae bacterium]MBH2006823.1 elongation factor P [Myxococcaceae bacterium]